MGWGWGLSEGGRVREPGTVPSTAHTDREIKNLKAEIENELSWSVDIGKVLLSLFSLSDILMTFVIRGRRKLIALSTSMQSALLPSEAVHVYIRRRNLI